MKIVEYNVDYLFDLHINFDKYPICKNNITLLHAMFEAGITKVILDDIGKALAIICVYMYHEGVAGVFIVPGIEAHTIKKRQFISGVLSLREELENIVRENKIRRIESLTMDDKKHNRWMEYLGFLAEGTKRSYGVNGEDFIMWSRLWV